MASQKMTESLRSLRNRLCAGLSPADREAGWTDAILHDVLKYLDGLELNIRNNKKFPYVSLAKTLDSVGINKGDLLDALCGFANDVNAGK